MLHVGRNAGERIGAHREGAIVDVRRFPCVGVAILCLVLAMLMFTGRDASLIAGYNAATPAERARYDGRKLGRTVGVLMLASGAFAAVMAVATWLAVTGRIDKGAVSAIGGVGGIVLVTVIDCTVWYANTCCFRRR